MRTMSFSHKIMDRQQAALAARELKQSGKRLVFTNGCFDLLHVGHVDLLYRAAALGDALILGLNTDASVRCLKGASRPVIPFAERAQVLAGLACVDIVVGFDEDTPAQLIHEIVPDVLIKGGDWPVSDIVGATEVFENGGTVESLALLPGHSTTRTIARIKAGLGAGQPDPEGL